VRSTAWKQRLFVLLVLVATGIAYLPALHAEFVWDDYEYIVDNQTLRDLDGLRSIWLEPRANSQYYPLVYTTFWIEYQLWELRPNGYHVINILLHAVNALLVWTLLRKLSLAGAWLAALTFALHPVHVESVAWVTERKNVLSGSFYLAAVLSYLRFRAFAVEPRPGPWRYYGLALLLFVCALFSKTVTASLPVALLLGLYWKTGRVRARDVVLLLPFFALGITAGLHTAWLERVHVGAAGADWNLTLLERWLIASRALCFYPAKLLWPEPLMFNYPRWDIDVSQWWQYFFGFAVISCLLLLWHARPRIGRGPLVAALFFAATLFPALGFVDLYPMRFSFVADHFQYLTSLGIIAPLAAGVARATRAIEEVAPGPGRWMWRAWVGVALLVLASLTFLQSRIYRDEETLWRDTLNKNPYSWIAHNNLGRILGFRREHDLAMQHFRRAVELKEDYYVAETNLAEALTWLGEHREAVDHLRHVLQIAPAHADAHFFLWVALSNLGQWDEAVHHLRRERALEPSFTAHFRAARLLGKVGRQRDALLELESAEKFRPRSAAVAFERGNLSMALDEPQQAAEAYSEAIVRRPGWAWAQNNLGLALERLGDLAQAEKHYAQAVSINPSHEPARRNLDRLRAQRHDVTIEERP
jgi:tetratricopeptide (TPR) repeat protein